MKIAFTCNNLNNGGAERVICNLANRMVEDGHSVHLICYSVTPSFYYKLNDGVEIIQLDKKIANRKAFILRKVAGIVNFIKLINALRWADKVISFYTRQNCYSIIACQLLHKPIICAERDHFFMTDGKLNHKMRNKWYPKSNGFIHQTQMARDWLRKKEGVVCDDVIIPNPLWMKEYPNRKPVKGYISAVGRLEEQKNYEEIIEAFEIVAENNDYATLHIFGDGPSKEKLQKMIHEKNLQNRIILEGITKDVAAIYAISDMYVMFSHGEGYPNALMEALAMGVPVISSDCPVGGPRDMITDGVNGILVKCSDINTFAERILDLLENSEMKAKFSKNAVKIRETNEFEEIYQQYMDYIMSVQ